MQSSVTPDLVGGYRRLARHCDIFHELCQVVIVVAELSSTPMIYGNTDRFLEFTSLRRSARRYNRKTEHRITSWIAAKTQIVGAVQHPLPRFPHETEHYSGSETVSKISHSSPIAQLI